MTAVSAEPLNGHLGFWMANLQPEHLSQPRFEGEDTIDLAIIGGGLTGLWAAYFAKSLDPSLSIAVLEAERIGYGASGRNGGWASALVPGNRARFARAAAEGKSASIALQQEFIRSVDGMLDTLGGEGIQADQHKGGTLSAAHTEAGLQRLLDKRQADLSYGYAPEQVQVLDRQEFKNLINIDDVHGGLFYPDVARIDPAKLVHGLAGVLESKGVRLYESSRVLSVENGTVTLEAGRVRAPMAFICTEGYSAPLLGPRRLIPINSSMIVTQRLDDRDWEHIGWNGLQCLNDSAHAFIYAQRTADSRIAIGGRGMPYRFASGTGGHGRTSEATVRQLLQKLHRFFPGIEFRAEHAWSGVLGVTRDWNASVTWDPGSGVGASVGYAGHGVTSAFVGARTLAELALGHKTERTQLPWVGYRSRSWEPEPIRWLGVHAMYRLFGIADAWEEWRGSAKTSALAKFGSRLAGLHE
ncbi:NAD(P)/FAD-dependent oxidoreductase [Arthrobacter mangrovi]|uniref:FAD-dependent oxidoreductase n=1 Tax=Arthrobacter mangrovi TaxID=2966350 RepID=A0ABQ5MYT2_9MICC|nr:FAD-dependent oxidoreductase [Arthrobacter mangrovi]GLB69123.1 FAD-dependent oxidoreductase [Arthrobacter mangrovi]